MNPAALKAFSDSDMENFVIASTPGGIEAQEAAGQQALVTSSHLPKDMRGVQRTDLETLGFKFSDTPSDDPLFVEAQLPLGWTKRPTEHSMWSEIVDEAGEIRFRIFYKAAFYDRCAFLCLARD